MIEQESPDVIISELMIPKVDGFLVREKIMESSDLKNKISVGMVDGARDSRQLGDKQPIGP